MRRLVSMLLAVAFAAGVFAIGVPSAPVGAATLSAAALSPGCQALNTPSLDGSNMGGSLGPQELWEGETIIISADDGPIPYTITLYLNATAVATANVTTSGPGTIVYTVPNDMTASVAWGYPGGNPLPIWTVSCQPRPVDCGAYLPLTADAVVGRFVADAPTYWAPGELVEPRVTIPAGKTAWVLGVDKGGQYYKIIWACDLLWVPKNTMGPNVGDPVWGGAPLPTGVVE